MRFRSRLAIGAAAAVVALLGVAAVVGWRLPPAALGAGLLEALRSEAGLTVAVGDARLKLFPAPHLRIDAITVADGAEAPFMSARAAVLTPRLSALFGGRVELEEITLKAPQLDLARLPASRLSAHAAPGRRPSLRVLNGVARFGDRAVESIDAGLVWGRGQMPTALTGSAMFAGRPIEASVTLSDAPAIRRGERARFRARVEGGGVRIVVDGAAHGASAVAFEGDIGARAANLRDALAWLGLPAPASGAGLAGVALSGRASYADRALSIADAQLSLPGGTLVGAGRMTFPADRPRIEATLDAERLDLTPFRGHLAPLRHVDGTWNAAPLDLAPLDALDLDLRVSAAALKIGPVLFGPTGATVGVRGGALDLVVGEAAVYGGSVNGGLTLERALGGGARVRLRGAASGVALGDVLADAVEKPVMAGGLTAEGGLDATGGSVAELVARARGSGSAQLNDGALGGFDSRAFAFLGFTRRMAVAEAATRFTVEDGVARAEHFRVSGPDGAIELSGDANLVTRRFDLRGVLRTEADGRGLPVRLEGRFSAPRFRPEFGRQSQLGGAGIPVFR